MLAAKEDRSINILGIFPSLFSLYNLDIKEYIYLHHCYVMLKQLNIYLMLGLSFSYWIY